MTAPARQRPEDFLELVERARRGKLKLYIGFAAALLVFMARNALVNMESRNITFGFSFLGQVAGFDIPFHLLSWDVNDSYGWALAVTFGNSGILPAGIDHVFFSNAGSEAVDGKANGVEVVWEWGAGNFAGGGGEEPSAESSGGGAGRFAPGEGDVVEVRKLADDEAGGFFWGGVGVGVGQNEVPGVIVTADEETDRWHQGAQGEIGRAHV